MEDPPFIAIVHNRYNSFCRLLVIYNSEDYYYSYDTEYKKLIHFKDSCKIIKKKDKYTVFSHNLNQKLVLEMRSRDI